MIYLSRMLGKPVVDSSGAEIGTVNDVAIATGEIFPRVTALAFKGPDKTPFMLSWRKYVETLEGDRVVLNAEQRELRFSYLQPDEVLLARDLMSKQIVDTQGMKVVRVNDLKLSESRNQLRLLGAEVGVRGILRGISPALERAVEWVARLLGTRLSENIIAWNYMDLLDRDLSHVTLSVTHKRLHELHPADVADVLEQLSPSQRARVFDHLDNAQAADTISELEDELQADVIDDLSDARASDILEQMDPDDAADIIGDLPYDKAETLLRLMGVKEARQVRSLLGYKEKTAGGIMTPEVTTVAAEMTVQQVIDHLRGEAAEHESIYYIYVVEEGRRLTGVVSLRDLIMRAPDTLIGDIAETDVFTANADDDQEDVAEMMSKYDLLALPVLDETGKLLGIVTVDDALDVLEEESAEDLALATGSHERRDAAAGELMWLLRKNSWVAVWAAVILLVFLFVRRLSEAPSAALTLFVPALIMLPMLLGLAEVVSQRAISEIIEDSEADEGEGTARRLLTEGLLGLGLGAFFGAVTFLVADVLIELYVAAVLAVVAGVSVPLVMLAGVGASNFVRARARRERTTSTTVLSLGMQIASTIIFFALIAAAGLAMKGL